MKKIMMLGGNFLQVTAIKKAKELGYYVITVDYLPDNPGHQYADEYHNISTIDKEKVLELAKKLQIDGILSYASDVSAPTAAYVSEKMGLCTNPYESVQILTHKDLFREFMKENHLSMPEGKMFTNIEEARNYAEQTGFPLMVKPVDSSGSKGVTRMESMDGFSEAFEEAMKYSIGKEVILERFIQKKGYQIDGDGFIKDGKIVFFGVMDQHNHKELNPYAPISLSYPSIQKEEHQKKAQDLIQSIFDQLNMKFGAFNFEYLVDEKGDVYILEIGPRNGGNAIPDTILHATGIDMIEASIRGCMGDPYPQALSQKKKRIAASYVIHASETGRYDGIFIDPSIQDKIIKQEIFVKPGEGVNKFRNGGDSIGVMVLEFDSVEEMNDTVDCMWKYIKVQVKE